MAIAAAIKSKAFFGQSIYGITAIIIFTLAGLYALHDFMQEHAITCLGIFLLPVLARTQKSIFSARYIWPALIFIALSFLSPAKTLAYFAWIFTFFLLAESFIGKLNYLPLLTAIVASPVFNYLLNIFGFSLRLQLTKAAGYILSIQSKVKIEGNSIIFRGEDFSVDPACMGLNLTATALIFGILFLFREEKRRKTSFSLFLAASVLLGFFILNILANLFRIVILVSMHIMPGTFMHEIIGLVCLFIYVLLPGYFLVQWLTKYAVKTERKEIISPGKRYKTPITAIFCLTFILMFFTGFRKTEWKDTHTISQKKRNGYTVKDLPNDITKIENNNALIYRKKIKEFYSTEHNPMICWTGSGYNFMKVKESNIAETPVYQGLLIKGSDTLHTAWWYQNGTCKTISQVDWRWREMKGEEKFYLVNISAESEGMLKKEITALKNLDINTF